MLEASDLCSHRCTSQKQIHPTVPCLSLWLWPPTFSIQNRPPEDAEETWHFGRTRVGFSVSKKSKHARRGSDFWAPGYPASHLNELPCHRVVFCFFSLGFLFKQLYPTDPGHKSCLDTEKERSKMEVRSALVWDIQYLVHLQRAAVARTRGEGRVIQ